MLRLGALAIEDAQLADAEAGQRKGDRLADTAGADHSDGAMRGGVNKGGSSSRKAGRVGVVADQAVIADNDGIDRADLRCIGRQFVEQIDHGFLVRKGDVDSGKAQPPNTLEQSLQFFSPGTGNLDELIMAAKAQCLGRPFVHGR